MPKAHGRWAQALDTQMLSDTHPHSSPLASANGTSAIQTVFVTYLPLVSVHSGIEIVKLI